MGWNSWNHFGCSVSADLVERTADAPGSGRIDARTFARWGVDSLKYDNCNHAGQSTTQQYVARYLAMRDALLATGRPTFFAI